MGDTLKDLAEQHRVMHEEHQAWLEFVKEWNLLHPQPAGFSLNAKICDPLVKAIELWGEKLVALRMVQEEEVRTQVLTERIDAYERAKTERI